jgi:Asp-tRNA(Asn)/Glu-tRNA(Gln) amidotransferase A subunit family amidase
MPTGCGSKLWANSYARRDATCVARLRDAGAVIMGKTVTTPYAYLDPPVTRNPWNLERTPGGSSSGSAAAVACAMCLGALGTQTGGSLTRPASYCGVYSLKPTYGRVSVEGVLPLAPSLDHVGVMARCLRDLAVIYEVLVQPFKRQIEAVDSMSTSQVETSQFEDYFCDAEPDLLTAYFDALHMLSGNTPQSICLPVGFSEIRDSFLATLSIEASEFHRQRVLRCPEDYPPKITELIESSRSRSAGSYLAAMNLRKFLTDAFNAIFEQTTFIVTPATRDFAPTRESTGSAAFNWPWSFIGLPTISVPVTDRGEEMPHSLQLIANHQNESQLFEVANELERSIKRKVNLPPYPATVTANES